MKKNVVRKWYTFLVLFSILMSVIIVGALGIYTIWDKTSRDEATVMNLTTEAKAAGLDLVLLKTEDAVDTVAAYVGARVATADSQLDEDVIQGGLEDEIQELFLSSVENVEGVTGYYVKFSEPYSDLVNGIAYQRDLDETVFHRVEETGDISETDEAGENADWFSLVAESGQPVWIPIRECSYTDGYIFSYAVPVYFDSELVGAACVDVDFEVLAKPIRDITVFGGGYAYLTDNKGTVYYHPLIGYGVLLTEDDDDVPEVDNALGDTSNHGELITYDYQGQKKKMAFQRLINDMRLVVTVNEEDMVREASDLIRNIILAAIGITVFFIALALYLEKRNMHPVLDRMEDLAHLDGMTGIQNKASFLEMQSYLNRKLQEGKAVFGFVMFDVNELKMINDKYGHKMGDIYLISTVEMIQDCFPGCQTYRIGGDEFVVLLEGEEAVHSANDRLQTAAKWQEKRREEKKEPWEKPSVACAFAAFDPKLHHSAEDVLTEADGRMYQRKQEMKSQKIT